MRGRNGINGSARPIAIIGEFEQLAHLVERKTQVARAADEAQAAKMLAGVRSAIPFSP